MNAYEISLSLENLTTEGLVNYMKEQKRMIKNELGYGRSARKYRVYLKAALMLLERRGMC